MGEVASGALLMDRAYREIRADILALDLPPGGEVSEAQLAERYELGKAPVRAALARLRTDGLVTSSPRRGYVIAPITLRDATEIMDMRIALEPLAARLASGRVDSRLLRRLDKACQAGYVPGRRDSERRFLAANRAIHVAVAEATGNRRLTVSISSLIDEMQRILHLALSIEDRGTELQHEHRQLIAALVEDNPSEAERLVRDALVGFRSIVVDVIVRSPDLLDSQLLPRS